MSLTLGLDVLLVTLLFIAIVYAIVLDHRLSSTKENTRLLAGLIEQFQQVSNKTKDELLKLKNTQERLRQELVNESNKALKLKTDLVTLLDAIDKRLAMTSSYIKEVGFEGEKNSTLTGVEPEISQSEEELLLMLKDLK